LDRAEGKRRGEGSVGSAGAHGREGGEGSDPRVPMRREEGALAVNKTCGWRRRVAVDAVATRVGRKLGRGMCGPSEKKERRNRPAHQNSGIFDLFKRISKGSELIGLKDGLPKF
jgi:hypothetical protein